MALWLERKYILYLGGQLRNFKQKSASLFNYSCPLCGDSHKNKFKARGYFVEKGDHFISHCHNCNASYKFPNFLKMINYQMYIEYQRELITENAAPVRETLSAKAPEPKFVYDNGVLSRIKKLSKVPSTHPVRLYVG